MDTWEVTYADGTTEKVEAYYVEEPTRGEPFLVLHGRKGEVLRYLSAFTLKSLRRVF